MYNLRHFLLFFLYVVLILQFSKSLLSLYRTFLVSLFVISVVFSGKHLQHQSSPKATCASRILTAVTCIIN